MALRASWLLSGERLWQRGRLARHCAGSCGELTWREWWLQVGLALGVVVVWCLHLIYYHTNPEAGGITGPNGCWLLARVGGWAGA